MKKPSIWQRVLKENYDYYVCILYDFNTFIKV